jgi:glucose-1-phosphate adenylyltransferase
MVERGRTGALVLPGYWRDLGQPHRYLRAHRELLTDDLGVLNDPDWPILTQHPQRAAARLLAGSQVEDSLVSSGCVVAGTVVRAVLGPGAVVEAGAVVVDSVVFSDVLVERDAVVAGSIIDTRSRIGGGATVGAPTANLDDSDQITLVGRDCEVSAGTTVEPGARLEPGTWA